MADYFISNDGSDSTGDGSAANPWATVGKAIDGGGVPAITLPGAGATRVILRGGDVFREAVTCRLAPTAAAPLEIVGDYDGALFGAAGVANPQKGVVEIRAWLNDTTTAGGSAIDLNGASYLTLSRLKLTAGGSVAVTATGSTNLTIRDCLLVGARHQRRLLILSVAAGVPANVTVERCAFICQPPAMSGGNTQSVSISAATAATGYDAAVRFDSCEFHSGRVAVEVALTGTDVAVPTGFAVRGCTFLGSNTAVSVIGSAVASKVADVVACHFETCQIALSATASGQIIEDYNVIGAGSRTNVAAGANSVFGPRPSLSFGDSQFFGEAARPFLEPDADSPLLGFAVRPAGLLTDLLGRARPDPCAAGCLERVDPTPSGGATYIFQTEG